MYFSMMEFGKNELSKELNGDLELIYKKVIKQMV